MAPAQPPAQQLTGLVARLTGTQKAILAGVALASVAAIVALVSAVNSPSFGILFSNLAAEDAATIVEQLRERSIDYQLEDAGRTILVPQKSIYDLRLALAAEGIPHSSVVGYEIFDRTNLGVSDFVQKVNYRRALEGELARTILQLNEVEGARVHLVLPARALFKEDEHPATASVVLKLRSGRRLAEGTVQGIANLVSASVEGMEPRNVTIVDSRGGLLSSRQADESMASLSSSQLEMQQKVERHLAQKAQSLLEGVVGTGNAIVQVAAELDFRQVERTLEQYDPERTAVRSEEIVEESTVLADSAAPSTRANTVTNYEINRTVEHIVESVGGVKRLSVAAIVNGIPRTVETAGETTTEIVPRSDQEMEKLTGLVRNAVGFNPLRNDELTVTSVAFGADTPMQEFITDGGPGFDWQGIAEKGVIGVAMIMAIVLLRSLLGRMRTRLERSLEGEPIGAFALGTRGEHVHLPSAEEAIRPDALLRAERRQRVVEYIQQKPVEGSRLLKVWLAED